MTGWHGDHIRSYEGNVVQIGESGAVVLSSATVLTDAQIKALPSTPVELVAAPGPGKFLLPIRGSARLAWTADYTNIDPASIIEFRTSNSGLMLPLREDVTSQVTNLLAGGGPDGTVALIAPRFFAKASYASSGFSSTAGYYDSDIENTALDISANNGSSGDFEDGDPDNVLTVTVLYAVVDF